MTVPMTISSAPETLADVALDEALRRIGELSGRLWAVRAAHRPGAAARRGRALGGRRGTGEPCCSGCGHPYPCPTVQAAQT